jgi:hypothetical protein
MKRSVLMLVLMLLVGCAVPSATAAKVSLWGEIPRDCACRDGESMARVSSDLQEAQVPVELRIENIHEGWQVFSVTFDPAQVPADRVRQILEGSGAQVIPAPASQ